MTRTIEAPRRTLPPLPQIDDATRREFLAGVAALLVLAPYGCGGERRNAPSGETRTIQHALGQARVPKDPRRVVALDPFFSLQVAVETGVPVVGSTVFSVEDPFPATLSEGETKRIESVGPVSEPNLETIASLEPDLIVGTTFADPPYDELRRIAPTVVIDDPFDWKPYVRSLGEATGRSETVEADLAEYEARVRDIRGRLRNATVSHAWLLGNETFDNYLEGPGSFGPFRVLDELGVERPPAEVTEGEDFSRTLSLEELPDLSGDVLFYNVGGGGQGETLKDEAEGVVDGPLWQKIPAVRDGEAYRLDPDHWMVFGGLHSANLVLDDVEKHLT